MRMNQNVESAFIGPTKACLGCQKTLSLDAFGKRSDSSDGKANRCVICMRAYKNGWQIRNPEKRAKANREYLDRRAVAEKPRLDTIKKCTKCLLEKPLSFFWSNRKTKDGRTQQCATCSIKERRQKHYGLSESDFSAMWADQNGLCPICTGTLAGPQHNACAVDHDHKTGRVRGLLCLRCNVGLGNFQDNADICAAAATYLKRNEGVDG